MKSFKVLHTYCWLYFICIRLHRKGLSQSGLCWRGKETKDCFIWSAQLYIFCGIKPLRPCKRASIPNTVFLFPRRPDCTCQEILNTGKRLNRTRFHILRLGIMAILVRHIGKTRKQHFMKLCLIEDLHNWITELQNYDKESREIWKCPLFSSRLIGSGGPFTPGPSVRSYTE